MAGRNIKESTADIAGDSEGEGGGGSAEDVAPGDGGGSGGGSGCGGGGGRSSRGAGGFHRLLPEIAEAIELLDEGTVEDVQRKIEELTSVRHPRSDVLSGLENGLKLGLFDVEREYTVNSKYLNDDLKVDGKDPGVIAMLVKKLAEENGVLRAKKHPNCEKDFRSKRMRSRTVRVRNAKANGTGGRAPAVRRRCARCNVRAASTTEPEDSSTGAESDSETDRSVASRTSRSAPSRKRSSDSVGGSTATKRKMVSPPESRSTKTNRQTRQSKLLVERNNLKNNPPYDDVLA